MKLHADRQKFKFELLTYRRARFGTLEQNTPKKSTEQKTQLFKPFACVHKESMLCPPFEYNIFWPFSLIYN